ncbi:ASST-domain-containing protein, partial [Coniella lustricola]
DELTYNEHDYNDGKWGAFPVNSYHSTDAFSPALQVNVWNKSAMASSGSHIVIQHDLPANAEAELNASPLILDATDLSTVYINRSFSSVTDVNVQLYENEPILTFYSGSVDDGLGFGNGYVFGYDESYNEIGLLTAEGLRVGADFHDFTMTGEKTAIITAYETISWDLSAYTNGDSSKGSEVLDSIFQEIDLDTFEVLFEWRASNHIPLELSFQPVDAGQYGWDFFHITSVQKSQSGDYLVSGAHMHSIYMIDGQSGDIKWTLGGKGNEFEELGYPEGKVFGNPLLTMAWQHHARFYPGREEKEFTVFDNHVNEINGWGCTDNCSRGLHFSMDTDNKKVQLQNEYLHPVGLWSISQGSVQVLDNNNVFIGWGRNPAITEHLSGGGCVFDIQFSPWRSPKTEWQGLESYRAYRVDWKGRPSWAPDIAAEKTRFGGVRVWASWNGATNVKQWVILGSKKAIDIDGANKVMARAARDGFETSMWLEASPVRYLRAVALDSNGNILKASGIFDL